MVIDEQTPDADLMGSFARGDLAAAEELYRRFAPRIFGLGRMMLGGDAPAQDLVQDTLVSVWRRADRYDAAIGRLETWVLLIARNLAIDALRRRVVESRGLDRLAPEREGSMDAGPEERAEVADLAARAKAAMAELPAPQRAAIELAYFGGKTGAEVAEIEGVPVGTAKTRIRDALLKLRGALEEHHDV